MSVAIAANTVFSGALLVLEESEDAEFDPNIVSPGVAGFLMTALLAAVVILLGFSFVRRMRRNAIRAQVRENIAAEIAERDAVETPGSTNTGDSVHGEATDAKSTDGESTEPGPPDADTTERA